MRPYRRLYDAKIIDKQAFKPLNNQSIFNNLAYPQIHSKDNRKIDMIVDFFSTYCICDIPPQMNDQCGFLMRPSMYKSNTDHSLECLGPHNPCDNISHREKADMVEYEGKEDDSNSEWISNPPEYYNVKKANIASMKDYNFETSYKHNKITGRILRYFVCKHDNCNRKFNKTWNFIDHVRIHTGEKPYKCSHCGKGFTQKGNYNKHLTLHSSDQN